MESNEKYLSICEELGWGITFDPEENVFELNQASPAGEDFTFYVPAQDFVQEVSQYAKDFDPNEHAEMWIRNREHTSGVPDATTLVDDAKDIGNMLNELSEALNTCLAEENGVKKSHGETDVNKIRICRHSMIKNDRFGPISCDVKNMSAIYDKMVRLTAKLTESYASDILYYFQDIEATKETPQFRLFAFRENGVNQMAVKDLIDFTANEEAPIEITSDDCVNGIYRHGIWNESDLLLCQQWNNFQMWVLIITAKKAVFYRADIRK